MLLKVRTIILLLLGAFAGLVWNMGTDFGLVFVHFAMPVVLGLVAALAFHKNSFFRKAMILFIAILLGTHFKSVCLLCTRRRGIRLG